MTVETYWPLLLLVIVPLLWRIQKTSTTALSPQQRQLSTWIRSAIVALIAFALMQPVVYRSGSYVSVVYLLDVSHSVAPASIQNAIQWIRQTNAAGKPAQAQFITFGSNSIGFDNLDSLSKVKVSSGISDGAVDQSGTDLAGAMDTALRSFDPNYLKRLVLITDGNDNSGELTASLDRLKLAGVRVETVPMQVRSEEDSWIENVIAPATITAEEQFPVEVQIDSQQETEGEVELRNGSKVLATKKVSLAKGLNRIAFETSVSGDAGPVVLEARASVAGDPFTANNVFRKAAVVSGKPRVLYVEGRSESAQYLQKALTSEGFSVDVATAQDMPSDVARLDGYDAVIISDVERKNLNEGQMEAVATYVKELGGGLILAGGENVYGEGGYSKTALESALPVVFNATKENKRPVAMVVVLDRSQSMQGNNILMAKEATKAPLSLLDDTDRYGVIAFDYNYRWALALQTITNRGEMKDELSKIYAVGETNIFPALKAAYDELAKPTSEVKHVILMSDGFSIPADFETLATKMAESHITVSTVAVGREADKKLLADIAMWGKGRAYVVQDAKTVPQLFDEETKKAQAQSLHEEPFRPMVKKSVEAFKGIDFTHAPELLGYVASKPKPVAEVLLNVYDDVPLLTRWQYGLGKAVVFSSDVKNRWAVNWIGWKSYPTFWSQLVRETMRRQEDDQFDFQVRRDTESAFISVHATQKDGRFQNKLSTQVRVISPDQRVSLVNIPQVGPGTYETRVPLTQQGSYQFRSVTGTTAGPARSLAYSYPDEYHFYPTNTEKLHTISQETGGVFQPSGPEIFSANGDTTSIPTPLWPWLAGLALVLYILDAYLRRWEIGGR